MDKEVAEDAQRKSDDAYGQEDHPPPLNAKGGVPTCVMRPKDDMRFNSRYFT